jgi:hypothetical protein
MKVSYLSGISGPMIAGTGSGNSGYCGIGATEGAVEWAKRNQVWQKYNVLQQAKIAAMKINPLAVGARGLILTLIAARNSGGLANMLKQARTEAAKNQTAWNKMRAIELKWLEAGGNPNELYEAIDKGATKTPRGKKFADLMLKVTKGEKLRVDQWLTAVISAAFGKRYNASTNGIGIAEPVTTTVTATATSSVWIPILQSFLVTLGTAIVGAVVSKVQPAEDETTTGGGATFPGGSTAAQGAETTTGKISTTTIIIGAAAALGALWYFTKKK